MSKFRTSWMKRRPKRNRRQPPVQTEAATSTLATQPNSEYPVSDRPSTPQPQASGPISPSAESGSVGGDGGLPETALFEQPRLAREDVRLARMAIRKHWEPKPEETHAVLTKATILALQDMAHHQTVIAVAKLHLDAHRQIQSDEHHDDRLEYYDRVHDHRVAASGGPVPLGIGVRVEGGGDVSVLVYVPDNERDPDGKMVRMPDFQDLP